MKILRNCTLPFCSLSWKISFWRPFRKKKYVSPKNIVLTKKTGETEENRGNRGTSKKNSTQNAISAKNHIIFCLYIDFPWPVSIFCLSMSPRDISFAFPVSSGYGKVFFTQRSLLYLAKSPIFCWPWPPFSGLGNRNFFRVNKHPSQGKSFFSRLPWITQMSVQREKVFFFLLVQIEQEKRVKILKIVFQKSEKRTHFSGVRPASTSVVHLPSFFFSIFLFHRHDVYLKVNTSPMKKKGIRGSARSYKLRKENQVKLLKIGFQKEHIFQVFGQLALRLFSSRDLQSNK